MHGILRAAIDQVNSECEITLQGGLFFVMEAIEPCVALPSLRTSPMGADSYLFSLPVVHVSVYGQRASFV